MGADAWEARAAAAQAEKLSLQQELETLKTTVRTRSCCNENAPCAAAVAAAAQHTQRALTVHHQPHTLSSHSDMHFNVVGGGVESTLQGQVIRGAQGAGSCGQLGAGPER